MKALSFRQPWAELILQGRKTLDLRSYSSTHRGSLAIHVAKKVEHEACRIYGLEPATLATGGIIGVVTLKEVEPLTAAQYEAQREAHLSTRRFREGLFGWQLSGAQRLPQFIPLAGRRRLFEVQLDERQVLPEQQPVPLQADLLPADSLRTYPLNGNGYDPDKPFRLSIEPLVARSSTAYGLALQQRLTEPLDAHANLTTISTLAGDNLRAVAQYVIEALRHADYKATDLSPERQAPFYLPEVVGVRLGLLFLAIKPLSKSRRIEEISDGIRQMPPEEAYYWYSKCTATQSAERAQKALRVLLAAE